MIVQPSDRLIYRQPIGTVAWMAGGWATPPNFTRSWGKMIAHCYENLLQPHEFIHQDDVKTSYHSAARNALATRFMGDWLIQFDADHEFEPDIVARMLGLINKWDVDVLTAVYRFINHPHLPNLYWWDDPTQSFVKIASLRNWDQPLTEIKCAGAGCLLVRRNVFDRIRKELKQEPFDIIHPYSEDFSFFRRCMMLGIKTYVAPQILSSHLAVMPITHESYDPSGLETVVI